MSTSAAWIPPVELCSASQPTSFAYESTVKRWPQILTGIIDELATMNSKERDDIKIKESQSIIASIAGLVYEIRHDRELKPIPDDGFPDDIALYNFELAAMSAAGKGNWFTVSWLYAECYMYRRIRTVFSLSVHYKSFDPFATQKINAFRSSENSIMTLATSFETLVKVDKERTASGVKQTEEMLRAEWIQMMEMCLWGNATDLSLLTSLTHEEIQALQSVERGSSFILKNDINPCYDYIRSYNGEKRIDIVLDNSGFELFTDFVLADWLLTLSPFCDKVVFHPKLLPWFVSDVLPLDFSLLISSLLSSDFFSSSDSNSTPGQIAALTTMVTRWQSYIDSGKFVLSVPLDLKLGEEINDASTEAAKFWTGPSSFADLPRLAPNLLKELQKSSLVIFKGDLNYRKLTSDACWPTTTSFSNALGPLKGTIPILSLRTCKADVCVGLKEGKAEELDVADKNWRVSGKYAVVSFCARD